MHISGHSTENKQMQQDTPVRKDINIPGDSNKEGEVKDDYSILLGKSINSLNLNTTADQTDVNKTL